ncbi:type-F conjugative transfer system protein TraW, partial [Acinetobacter baumannii]
MKKILLVGLIFCSKAFASDFGVIGKTYPIKETDLIVAMQKRMAEKVKNGEFKAEIDRMKKRTQQYVARPKGITLPVARQYSAV